MATFGFNINSTGATNPIAGLQGALKRLQDMNWNILLMQDDTGAGPKSAGDQEEWPPYHLSKKGREFIVRHETYGRRSNLKLYIDPAGNATIGYGHLVKHSEDFSNGVTMDQAMARLGEDVRQAADEVNAALNVPLAQSQFDALVDLAFNEGSGSVAPNNEFMPALKGGHLSESNFTQYDIIHVKGRKKVSQGLLDRRIEEWLLFEKGEY